MRGWLQRWDREWEAGNDGAERRRAGEERERSRGGFVMNVRPAGIGLYFSPSLSPWRWPITVGARSVAPRLNWTACWASVLSLSLSLLKHVRIVRHVRSLTNLNSTQLRALLSHHMVSSRLEVGDILSRIRAPAFSVKVEKT